MKTVYIFFDGENVRIPFTDFDKGLFNQLVKSNMGNWENTDQQYHISRSKYDPHKIQTILDGKAYVEVGKETDNPVNVHGFISSGDDETDETVTAAAPATESETVTSITVPDSGLPDRFPGYWEKKLEMEMSARNYSPHTRTAYINYNKNLCRYLQKPPEDVASGDITRYLAYLEQVKRHSAATLNYNLSAFKFFYRNIMKRDTVCEQKRPRQSKRLPVVLSKYEVKKIFDSEPNLKHRLLLMMIYASGFRVSEIVSLKRKDIDIDRKIIMIVGGKGRKDRNTIISQLVIETLKTYYAQYTVTDWLFTGADPLEHLSIRSAQHICKHALKRAKIGKTASIHSLRHTFATHLLESGTDIMYIKELLGHGSIKTTERYTHVARRKMLRITSPLDTLDQPEDD